MISLFIAATAPFTPYYCGGIASNTLWVLYGASGITMTIDTTACGFTSVPLYFTSLDGNGHWGVGGYTAIYSASTTGFTVYAKPLDVWSSSSMLSSAYADAWDLNWFGITHQ